MKNLQINNPSMGQQGYNLVEKVSDDINIFVDPLPNLVNIPEGLSIIDGSGNIIAADDYASWDEEKGLTGIGVNSSGHKFIFAVADEISIDPSSVDDGLISSPKMWSQHLYGIDVPGLTNYTDETLAVSDFASRVNTDAIIEAMGEAVETDNAARVARNYSAGVIGQGKWDLPALGILIIINDFKSSIRTLMTNINKVYWNNLLMGSLAWSSTEVSSYHIWYFNFYTSSSYSTRKDNHSFVVPVYTIA